MFSDVFSSPQTKTANCCSSKVPGRRRAWCSMDTCTIATVARTTRSTGAVTTIPRRCTSSAVDHVAFWNSANWRASLVDCTIICRTRRRLRRSYSAIGWRRSVMVGERAAAGASWHVITVLHSISSSWNRSRIYWCIITRIISSIIC